MPDDNPHFHWQDLASAGCLVIQLNDAGVLRLCQRMPVGGGALADIPLCQGGTLRTLAVIMRRIVLAAPTLFMRTIPIPDTGNLAVLTNDNRHVATAYWEVRTPADDAEPAAPAPAAETAPPPGRYVVHDGWGADQLRELADMLDDLTAARREADAAPLDAPPPVGGGD